MKVPSMIVHAKEIIQTFPSGTKGVPEIRALDGFNMEI